MSHCPSDWIWTLDHKIVIWVFLHCPTRAHKMFLAFFHHFMSTRTSGDIWTLDHKNVIWVFYHCPTGAQQNVPFNLTYHFLSYCLWPDSIPWSYDSKLSVLQLYYWGTPNFSSKAFCHFLYLIASGGIWTLNLRILSKVFYHCTTGSHSTFLVRRFLATSLSQYWNPQS